MRKKLLAAFAAAAATGIAATMTRHYLQRRRDFSETVVSGFKPEELEKVEKRKDKTSITVTSTGHIVIKTELRHSDMSSIMVSLIREYDMEGADPCPFKVKLKTSFYDTKLKMARETTRVISEEAFTSLCEEVLPEYDKHSFPNYLHNWSCEDFLWATPAILRIVCSTGVVSDKVVREVNLIRPSRVTLTGMGVPNDPHRRAHMFELPFAHVYLPCKIIVEERWEEPKLYFVNHYNRTEELLTVDFSDYMSGEPGRWIVVKSPSNCWHLQMKTLLSYMGCHSNSDYKRFFDHPKDSLVTMFKFFFPEYVSKVDSIEVTCNLNHFWDLLKEEVHEDGEINY